MSDGNLWERQPGETAKAYAAFLLYRDLPAVDRTIVAAVVEHRKLGGKASVRNWETWASRYNWRERGLANDSDLASRRRERMEKELDRAKDDAAVLIRALLGKVKEREVVLNPADAAPAAITWTPSPRTGSSPSATQGPTSTTPRKALSLRPWWTRDRSVIACLTKRTMP